MENKVNNFEAVMNASGLTDNIIVEAAKSWRNHVTKTINGYDVEYYKGRKNKHRFYKFATGYVREPDKIMKLSFQKNKRDSLTVIAHECFHMEEYYSRKQPLPGAFNGLYSTIQEVSGNAKSLWVTSENGVVFSGSDEELFLNMIYILLPRELKANLFSFWKMEVPETTLFIASANSSAIAHLQMRTNFWTSEDIFKWWNAKFDAISHSEAEAVLANIIFNINALERVKICKTKLELAALFNEIDDKQCEVFKRTITF